MGKQSRQELGYTNEWDNSDNSRTLRWEHCGSQGPSASPAPEQSQAEHTLPRPTLVAPVIPACPGAEAMGPVPQPCAGVRTQPQAPLHGQLLPEVLPQLQPRAGSFALCLWIPTAWRVWLEQSQPRGCANGRRETIAMRRCFLPFKVFTCAAQAVTLVRIRSACCSAEFKR